MICRNCRPNWPRGEWEIKDCGHCPNCCRPIMPFNHYGYLAYVCGCNVFHTKEPILLGKVVRGRNMEVVKDGLFFAISYQDQNLKSHIYILRDAFGVRNEGVEKLIGWLTAMGES